MNTDCSSIADMEEYMASLYSNDNSTNDSQDSDGTDSADEVEFIQELKASLDDHQCALCCEGTFLVNKLLEFGGVSNGPYVHICEICDKGFKTKSAASRHAKMHERGDFIPDTDYVKECKRSIGQRETWTCSICSFTCKSEMGLKRHTTNQHRESTHLCELCGMKFFNFKKFNQHCIDHTSSSKKLLTCFTCDKKFLWKKSMQNHICNLYTK